MIIQHNENSNSKRRDELLLKMYDQLWNSINSHLLGIWQSIGVVIGALAVIALVEKQILPIDWAVTIIVVLCCWLLANVLDSSYWYNRNLVIIANIEKDFLVRSDAINISYYFVSHTDKNNPITHFKIQYVLGMVIEFLFLLYHFALRIYPNLFGPKVDIQALLPYVVSIMGVFILWKLNKYRNKEYEEILSKSPGKDLTS